MVGTRKRTRYAALTAALAAVLTGGGLAAAPPASSQAADGTVTVRVVRAVDATGVWTPALEPGIAGVTVTLTDGAGVRTEGTTATDGTVTLAPAAGGAAGGTYRVQVVNPQPGVLFPAFASRQGLDGAPDQLGSDVEFVDLSDGRNVRYTTGLWYPGDYCQQNAPLVTACQNTTWQGGAQRTLVSFPYGARGQDGVDVNVAGLATDAQTGTLFGVAWNKADRRVFASAAAKRTTDYGPGGSGGIYVTDPAGGATTLFTTVPDAGATPHGPGTDDAFLAVPGRESLGGLKVTEDGRHLFVVNLHTRALYRYDATAATAAAPEAVYPIPDPGCPAAGDWRPFGLGLQDGVGYLGGVCSGESTGRAADLRAVVLPFDPATGLFRPAVLDQPLDYPRQSTVGGGPCDGAGWFPWTDTYPTEQHGQACSGYRAQPEPELAEVGFETDGSMLLSFRDRLADRATGQAAAGAAVGEVLSGGDLNKACPVDGRYVLDADNGCGLSPRGTRFFDTSRFGVHHNADYAGMALSKVESTVGTSGYDPNNTAFGYGTAFLRRTDGTPDAKPGLRLNPADRPAPFGKGASMGDLEVLCDRAPLQIGNRVWYDPGRTGVQRPGQRPVPGVTVHLYDAAGTLVGTTRTSARGEYYFDDSDVTGGLRPHTRYTVRLDEPADYAQGGPLYQWAPTRHDVGDDPALNSKGVVPRGGTFPERELTTGGPGENDHTLDFGFRPRRGVLTLVKHDQDGRPLAGATFQLWRTSGGPGRPRTTGGHRDTPVGEPCTTGADGICRASGGPGTYFWVEVRPPEGYAADATVIGPLVLTCDNLGEGITVTVVNRRIGLPWPPLPTPPPDPATSSPPLATPPIATVPAPAPPSGPAPARAAAWTVDAPTARPLPSPDPADLADPADPADLADLADAPDPADLADAPGLPDAPDLADLPGSPPRAGGPLPSTGAGPLLPLGLAGATALVGAGGTLALVGRRRGARRR
ncbi:SdrD B-like domain-containing protein [Kitasatospora sp. NPDC018623]|uniref:SdrD B-like domain-containing protein n=1 Tax=unclassified Kitasatospora TaxID=2633591 RepID=UPI0037973E7E